MALDALTLHLLCGELRQKVLGGRITKIHQLSKEELVLTLSGQGEIGGKLFLSARADAPRIHLTGEQYPNPATPPMFCMLLRKHLSGWRMSASPKGSASPFWTLTAATRSATRCACVWSSRSWAATPTSSSSPRTAPSWTR